MNLQESKVLEVSGFFGISNENTDTQRIELKGFAEQKYRIAIAIEKPFLFGSRFIETKIKYKNSITTVWINVNSFRKRFSGDEKAAHLLIKILPEKFIPGLKEKFPITNPSNCFSRSDATPLALDNPPLNDTDSKGKDIASFHNTNSKGKDTATLHDINSIRSLDSTSSSRPNQTSFLINPQKDSSDSPSLVFSQSVAPLFYDADSKDKAPPQDLNPLKSLVLSSSSSSSVDSTSSFQASGASFSINPLIKENRVDLIQDTIRRYSPFSYIPGIARYCSIADQEASKLSPRTIAKIAAKKYFLGRSILIGPSGKFLLLPHVRTGKDYLIGNGAYKKAKLAVNLDTGQIKTVAIAKKSNLAPYKNWEDAKKNISHELERTMEAGKNNKDVVHLDFGHKSNQRINPDTGKIAEEEKYYFIMDYCDDGNLSERKRGSSEFEKHQWTLEIARGLATMHQQGILHRDVKPENIFLQEGHAKIGDLGFACTTKEAETNRRPGTRPYMAPECLDGKQTSIKSDAWSFGCVVFELFVQNNQRFSVNTSSEFKGDQVRVDQRIDRKDSRGSYLIPNPECRKLLKGLLTLDPELRMTIEEFYEKFSQIPTPDPE